MSDELKLRLRTRPFLYCLLQFYGLHVDLTESVRGIHHM
jgi:hypothetical protein